MAGDAELALWGPASPAAGRKDGPHKASSASPAICRSHATDPKSLLYPRHSDSGPGTSAGRVCQPAGDASANAPARAAILFGGIRIGFDQHVENILRLLIRACRKVDAAQVVDHPHHDLP